MLARSTLCALVAALALALLSTTTEAHSWADCVDWRFNNPNKPGWTDQLGKCFGYARQFPYKNGVKFGKLDSADPNRHYEQSHTKDPDACSNGHNGKEPGSDESRKNPISKAYGGKWGPMSTAVPGQKMCIRWPSKNHAPEDGVPDVFVYMPKDITTKDLKQSQLLKSQVARLPFDNCNEIGGKKGKDLWPCGGCFNIPKDLKTGTYMVQWRWELNRGEFYTSCWDVRVNAANAPKTNTINGNNNLNNATSVFSELAEN